MTAEEDRLVAFLVGETDRAPRPADYRVPRQPRPRIARKAVRKKKIAWTATGRKTSP
jgi:hypothetical protein